MSDEELNSLDYLGALEGADRPVPFRALRDVAPEESPAVRWMWLVTAGIVTLLFVSAMRAAAARIR